MIPKDNWRNKSEYKLYLNLLAASRLKYLNRSSRNDLAYNFEKICKITIEGWLTHFDFKLFSLQSDDRRTFFDTNLRNALIKLAGFIKEDPNENKINKKKKDNSFYLSPSGDNGLDLVGVKKFPDQERGAIVIFGQCTTQNQNFEKKTLDAHALNFRDYMTFSNDPINMVFIPTLYRDNNNHFIKEKPLQNCLLVDRQRLLSMIKPEYISKMPLCSFEIA